MTFSIASRALIVHVEASALLRLLCDDPTCRNDVDADLVQVQSPGVCEHAFEDNARVYLQQGAKVNRNINATLLSPEKVNFFYFNNGITITCDHFSYPTGRSSPIIEMKNIQVVNGGHTVHALFEAFELQRDSIEPVELLCRIYETKNAALSSSIAERTNSQTPVKSRDIQSIDIVQIKLEKEFFAMGLYDERKSAQHSEKPKHLRVDTERCGQVALAFDEQLPLEAKNRKGLIFGESYDSIFSENTNAHRLLSPLRLFEKIEAERIASQTGVNAWLRYANYHILFALRVIADKKAIPLDLAKLDAIWKLYALAKRAVRGARAAALKRTAKTCCFSNREPRSKFISQDVDATIKAKKAMAVR